MPVESSGISSPEPYIVLGHKPHFFKLHMLHICMLYSATLKYIYVGNFMTLSLLYSVFDCHETKYIYPINFKLFSCIYDIK